MARYYKRSQWSQWLMLMNFISHSYNQKILAFKHLTFIYCVSCSSFRDLEKILNFLHQTHRGRQESWGSSESVLIWNGYNLEYKKLHILCSLPPVPPRVSTQIFLSMIFHFLTFMPRMGFQAFSHIPWVCIFSKLPAFKLWVNKFCLL